MNATPPRSALSGSSLRRAYLVLTRAALSAVFISSALPALLNPYEFLSSLYTYEVFSPKTGQLIAMVIPWIELISAVFLLSGFMLPGALLTSLLLTSTIAAAQASILTRGLEAGHGLLAAMGGAQVEGGTLTLTIALSATAMVAFALSFVAEASSPRWPGPE